MKIRKMSIADYEKMHKLWIKTPGICLHDSDKKGNIKRFLKRNENLNFICEEKDYIVGTILCGHDGRRGYIYHLVVDENYRGGRMGEKLVAKSLGALRKNGILKCHSFVLCDNELGIAFWKKVGWIKRDDIYVFSKNI